VILRKLCFYPVSLAELITSVIASQEGKTVLL
jgi:hypothetical protein